MSPAGCICRLNGVLSESTRMFRKTRLKLPDLNQHLLCSLCHGYLIDATTIIECLHSFCRSCIVRYLETCKVCPVCKVQIHKTRPLVNIRRDKTLQDLVYKLVPGLLQNEMKRRQEFYQAHQPAGEAGCNHNITKELHCDIEVRPDHKDQEQISICLQHTARLPPYKNDLPGVRCAKHPDKTSEKRFLLCPAELTIGHLKKFIRCKFDLLNPKYKIEVFYSDESLPDDYTLTDVGYIYTWRRLAPLKLYYLVYDQTKIVLYLPQPSMEQPIRPDRTQFPQKRRGRKRKILAISEGKAITATAAASVTCDTLVSREQDVRGDCDPRLTEEAETNSTQLPGLAAESTIAQDKPPGTVNNWVDAVSSPTSTLAVSTTNQEVTNDQSNESLQNPKLKSSQTDTVENMSVFDEVPTLVELLTHDKLIKPAEPAQIIVNDQAPEGAVTCTKLAKQDTTATVTSTGSDGVASSCDDSATDYLNIDTAVEEGTISQYYLNRSDKTDCDTDKSFQGTLPPSSSDSVLPAGSRAESSQIDSDPPKCPDVLSNKRDANISETLAVSTGDRAPTVAPVTTDSSRDKTKVITRDLCQNAKDTLQYPDSNDSCNALDSPRIFENLQKIIGNIGREHRLDSGSLELRAMLDKSRSQPTSENTLKTGMKVPQSKISKSNATNSSMGQVLSGFQTSSRDRHTYVPDCGMTSGSQGQFQGQNVYADSSFLASAMHSQNPNQSIKTAFNNRSVAVRQGLNPAESSQAMVIMGHMMTSDPSAPRPHMNMQGVNAVNSHAQLPSPTGSPSVTSSTSVRELLKRSVENPVHPCHGRLQSPYKASDGGLYRREIGSSYRMGTPVQGLKRKNPGANALNGYIGQKASAASGFCGTPQCLKSGGNRLSPSSSRSSTPSAQKSQQNVVSSSAPKKAKTSSASDSARWHRPILPRPTYPSTLIRPTNGLVMVNGNQAFPCNLVNSSSSPPALLTPPQSSQPLHNGCTPQNLSTNCPPAQTVLANGYDAPLDMTTKKMDSYLPTSNSDISQMRQPLNVPSLVRP